jgi:hypothetical protein
VNISKYFKHAIFLEKTGKLSYHPSSMSARGNMTPRQKSNRKFEAGKSMTRI